MGQEQFDMIIEGKPVSLYHLENSKGTRLSITNYGCRIQGLQVKDQKGNRVDVVMGFPSINGYLEAAEIYHGATIGRFANRIANGKFTLRGVDFQLATNNPPNHLHGGPGGFHSKVWRVDEVLSNEITLSYLSPDGEEEYPGNLQVEIKIGLTEENEVYINYLAESDEPTILNLTNHSYFNLNGTGSGSILHHRLQIMADLFSAVNDLLLPTGSLPVVDTPFDFREAKPIGERINEDHIQLHYGNGYDHNYILSGSTEALPLIARVYADISGITMEVFTDQPGVQFYVNPDRTAFCLETQHFPDSPNHPEFPTTVLEAGDEFRSKTVYKFSC